MTRQEILNSLSDGHLNFSKSRQTTDLQMLCGLPIVSLVLSNLKYSSADFAFLKGLPIQALALRYIPLTRDHFRALAGLPLNQLCLHSCSLATRDDLNDLPEVLPQLDCFRLWMTSVKTTDFTTEPVRINLVGLHGLSLTRLSLHSCATEADLWGLQHLPLTELDLTGTDLSKVDLTCLGRLRQLTKLTLHNTGWNGVGFKGLTGLKLSELDLSSVKLENLADLREFPLRTLILSYSAVTPADLKALNQLPLTALGLSSTKLTDFKELAGFSQLRILYLSDTQVTGACLKELDALPLTEIYLIRTPVAQDEDALAYFRSKHPNCSIHC